MKIKVLTAFVLSIALFFLGCSDSSPLKSDLEVAINKTYGMQFDYLDHVQVFKRGEDKAFLDLQGDQIRDIVLTLANAEVTSEEMKFKTYHYKIVLSTSPEGKEYNKKQTSAELFVYPAGDVTFLTYNNKHYKLSEGLKSFGIE